MVVIDEHAIITMNANGPSVGGGSEMRKKGIERTLNSVKPLMVFVQEFHWKSLHSRAWGNTAIPDHYEYFGHAEAGFVFDMREVTFSRIDNQTSSRRLHEQMLRSGRWSSICEMSRLCVFKVGSKGALNVELLCASWHGPYKVSNDKKIEILDSLLTYLLRLKVNVNNLPLILGGDFNLKASDVKKCLPGCFVMNTPNESSIDLLLTTSDFGHHFQFSKIEMLEEDMAFDHRQLKIAFALKSTNVLEDNENSDGIAYKCRSKNICKDKDQIVYRDRTLVDKNKSCKNGSGDKNMNWRESTDRRKTVVSKSLTKTWRNNPVKQRAYNKDYVNCNEYKVNFFDTIDIVDIFLILVIIFTVLVIVLVIVI